MWYSEFWQCVDLFVHNEVSEEHFATILSVEMMEMKKKVFGSVVIWRDVYMFLRRGSP
jgi:hypothetical protein